MTDLNRPGSIERTIALTEIYSILNRYAVMAKEQANFDKIALLFRPDGFFRMPNGTVLKPANLVEVTQGDEAKYIRHNITGIDVHFKSETEAHTRAQFLASTHMSVTDHWGSWNDILTRDEDGRWLIYDRNIEVDGFDPKGWCAEKFHASK